ncbi:MAG: hypothetical protein EOP84_29550 [Verrucomicrobiaceae bacterium]|nr:MAG: hypothetical protein EOP84_29550 [Verrucomicrobiaceae bacterium]
MIDLLLIVAAQVSAVANPSIRPCVPVPAHKSHRLPSGIRDHRMLREALGEPIPSDTSMIMLYGVGGHHVTTEYSIIVVRAPDGAWRGTAVGRNQIWTAGAPYTPMTRAEWLLSTDAGRQLDQAISHRCKSNDPTTAAQRQSGAPPIGTISERIDIVQGKRITTFYADPVSEAISALIRPPR